MQSQIHYLIRSKVDGKYLVANIQANNSNNEANYLLLFQENFEALSYINTHGKELADRFGVESVSNPQLKAMIKRWGYQGVGLVKDPIRPDIEFLTIA